MTAGTFLTAAIALCLVALFGMVYFETEAAGAACRADSAANIFDWYHSDCWTPDGRKVFTP